jgi:hypothetical protein
MIAPHNSHIVQNAVKHHSGIFLTSIATKDTIQYEDLVGNVLYISGGFDYLDRPEKFPGKGCEDYSITTLTPKEEVYEKLLNDKSIPVKDMELKDIEEVILTKSAVLNPIVLDCFLYHKEQKQ